MVKETKICNAFHMQLQSDLNLMKDLVRLCKKQEKGIREYTKIEDDLIECMHDNIVKAEVPLTVPYVNQGDQLKCNCTNFNYSGSFEEKSMSLKNLSSSWHQYLKERQNFNCNIPKRKKEIKPKKKINRNKCKKIKETKPEQHKCPCTNPYLKNLVKMKVGKESCCKCNKMENPKGKVARTISYIKTADCSNLGQFGVKPITSSNLKIDKDAFINGLKNESKTPGKRDEQGRGVTTADGQKGEEPKTAEGGLSGKGVASGTAGGGTSGTTGGKAEVAGEAERTGIARRGAIGKGDVTGSAGGGTSGKGDTTGTTGQGAFGKGEITGAVGGGASGKGETGAAGGGTSGTTGGRASGKAETAAAGGGSTSGTTAGRASGKGETGAAGGGTSGTTGGSASGNGKADGAEAYQKGDAIGTTGGRTSGKGGAAGTASGGASGKDDPTNIDKVSAAINESSGKVGTKKLPPSGHQLDEGQTTAKKVGARTGIQIDVRDGYSNKDFISTRMHWENERKLKQINRADTQGRYSKRMHWQNERMT